jgi:hypothetical protein
MRGISAAVPPQLAWIPGIAGSAIQFPGSELVIRGRDPGILPRGTDPRTFAAWVRTATTNGDTTVIFQQGNPDLDSGSDHFYLTLEETGVAGFGSNNVLFGRRRIDDGQWHQLAGVFEGGDRGLMHLYVDGVEDVPPAAAQGVLERAPESWWAIGRRMRGGTSFRGAVDDVRVFGRALRPAEIRDLYRCMTGPVDIEIGGRPYYFGQIHGSGMEVEPPGLGEISTPVRHTGNDFGGVTFLSRQPGCPSGSLASADIGQDFRFEVELQLDAPPGLTTEGGPYFRSRSADPGDGIIGGTSAGFWVQLSSTGQIRVIRLHPMATIAFSEAPAGFDDGVFHKVEARVKDDALEVSLDGRVVEFDSGGRRVSTIDLTPRWETAAPRGYNKGSAGLAFSCVRNRGSAGGQRARNIRVRP